MTDNSDPSPEATPADARPLDEVVLTHPGGELTMPVVPAPEGAAGINVGKLLASTGMVTLDNGFVNTASCSSTVTYI
ncbi:MAG: hypothetical protein H0T99_09015, partial [Geodermatophilaceae bacterium]|nr:hypothetical protein [Geodermatophilaceae bacterium]